MIDCLKAWVRVVMRDVVALSLALGDPRVPWVAKLLAAAVVAYALSPIDLIPDFIPVLGYLDDLVLLPLGLLLVVRLIPRPVMADLRARSLALSLSARPRSRTAAVVIVALWIAAALAVAAFVAGSAG